MNVRAIVVTVACGSLQAIASLGAQVAPPVAPRVGEIVTLPAHAAWCATAAVPKDGPDSEYDALLVKAVQTLDAALRPGSSTGTPFIASSARRTAPAPGEGVAAEYLDVSICTVVPGAAGTPPAGEVRRVARGGERVFAGACPIAEVTTCIDTIRAALVTALGEDRKQAVEQAFWWSVRAKERPVGAAALAGALTAGDLRRVTAHPAFVVTGDLRPAAALREPIEKQSPRPLMVKRPGWFDVIGTRADRWLVIGIEVPVAGPATPGP